MASSRHRKRRLMETRAVRIGLRVFTFLVVAFLWIPLLIIMLYAFNSSTIQSWPISSYTFHWFRDAWHDQDVRSALWLSARVGLLATGIALVLGSAAAFAIHRFRFFGRESGSFRLLLRLALPGIITGMALNSAYVFAGVSFSIWTIVTGHATFCVVVVYNNVLARLRRTSPSLIEASMLAFALSFDEVIVTTFTAGAQTTLPIFILDKIQRGQELPIVNAVVFVVILATVIPVIISQRLTQ